MSEIETKKCSKCGDVKHVSEFYRNAKMSDGYARYDFNTGHKIEEDAK